MSLLRDLVRPLMPMALRRKRAEGSLAHELAETGEAELVWLDRLVKRGDVALDIGANSGIYAWTLARLGAQVIAFEPNPSAADKVSLLAKPNIDLRRYGLSDSEGSATLTLPESRDGLGTLRPDAAPADAPRFDVPIRKLDTLDLPKVDFIKIDIEGHEEAAIAGGMGLIARDKPVLLVEIEDRHNAGGFARIVKRLTAIGYTGWFLMDGGWHPIAEFAMDTHQRLADLAPMREGAARRSLRYFNNFLFLPAGRTVPGSH